MNKEYLSNKDRLNKNATDKTNNVINSIMPFDIQNCVQYNANYLKSYTSERRDTNVDNLREIVENQAKDVAKFAANDTLKDYDRGVRWTTQNMSVKGTQWKSAYLPVWLYSYQQVNGEKKVLHYVAVNGRTKETMGSVPIYLPKLFLVSFLVEILGMLFVDFDYNWCFLLAGFIYFFIIYGKYRNKNASHKNKNETKTQMDNLRKIDRLIRRRTGLVNPKIEGANNTSISGQTLEEQMLNKVMDFSKVSNFMNNNDKNQKSGGSL